MTNRQFWLAVTVVTIISIFLGVIVASQTAWWIGIFTYFITDMVLLGLLISFATHRGID